VLDDEKPIEIQEDVFHLFRDLIYESSGVVLNEGSRHFVGNRLRNSVRQRRLDNFRDYYHFLKYDRKKDEELANVIDLLTIHETYFFREDQQLKTFSEEVLPELAKRKSKEKTLRIWSAGCSTGEEPYTLSILFRENREFRDWDVQIIGTDISRRVLQSARKGVYQPPAFRATSPYYQQKYFVKEEGGIRVVDEVRQNVMFLWMNLFDEGKLALIHSMDAIFCRNVIIYFDTKGKKKLVDTFFRKLKEGGYLLMGHSESLINLTTAFALRHFKYDMVYQKQNGSRGGG
jgi:chemotaxis protein methyltransferase CheR